MSKNYMLENLLKIKKFKKEELEKFRTIISEPQTNLSYYENYPIRLASRIGNTDAVKILLDDPRVDPSAKDNEAIRLAADFGHFKVVKFLIEDPRVDPSVYYNEAIINAAKSGHLEIVKLLSKDPRVDWRDIKNETVNLLLKDEMKELGKEMIKLYLNIEKGSPQINIEGKRKSGVPKPIIKKIVNQTFYSELCEVIKGEIPPVKLVALASFLNIDYNLDNISWSSLCGKVKEALLLSLY